MCLVLFKRGKILFERDTKFMIKEKFKTQETHEKFNYFLSIRFDEARVKKSEAEDVRSREKKA